MRRWLLTAVVALLVALLAVAQDLATDLVPAGWRWAHDPRVLWSAVIVLGIVVAVLTTVQQRVVTEAEPAGHHATGAAVDGQPTVFNLPPRNPNFTGRGTAIEAVRQALRQHSAAVVVAQGLGGIGKTQLALEFAHRASGGDAYPIIWWIRAESPLTIAEDLAALAPALGVPVVADREATVAAVRRALAGRTRWLLVFDNASDAASVRPWLPAGPGNTLITSRNPGWGDLATRVELEEFTRAESVAYLLRRGRRADPAAADALAEALGDLPLALAQAAAYLETHGNLSLAGYLERYRDQATTGQILAAGMADYPHSVATTWVIHFQELNRHPAALQLLQLCAHLDPDSIDLDLLLSRPELLAHRRTAKLGRAAADPATRREAIDWLARTGLVTRLDDDHVVRVHRLVSQVTRHHLVTTSGGHRWPWQRQPDDVGWATQTIAVLDGLFPAGPRDPNAWPTCASLSLHALTASDLCLARGVADATAGHLLRQLGSYFSARGEFQHALLTFTNALSLLTTLHGETDPAVAATLNDLGSAQHDAGDLDAAYASLSRALHLKETEHGPYHPTVAVTLNNLGNVLQDLGRVDQALECLRRALQIKEAAYGEDHLEVAYALTNLGLAEPPEDGLASLRRALWITESVLGPDHQRVAVTLNSLGMVQHALGDAVSARASLERALRINETRYGPDHPRVAITLHNLGVVQQHLADAEGAQSSLRRALRIKETVYGPDHPQVTLTRSSLDAG